MRWLPSRVGNGSAATVSSAQGHAERCGGRGRRNRGCHGDARSRSISAVRCCWSSRAAWFDARSTSRAERSRRRRRDASRSSGACGRAGRGRFTCGFHTRSTSIAASRSTASRSFPTDRRVTARSGSSRRCPFVFRATPLGTFSSGARVALLETRSAVVMPDQQSEPKKTRRPSASPTKSLRRGPPSSARRGTDALSLRVRGRALHGDSPTHGRGDEAVRAHPKRFVLIPGHEENR